MKTAIIYYSSHHGNTKKLLDAIVRQGDVALIEAASGPVDLSAYDVIGFASGIYYAKFHESVLQCAETNLTSGKKVFFIYTCGVKKDTYINAIKQITDAKGAELLGVYGCVGWDTTGPFKLMGGIAKGHPNEEEIAGAVRFFQEINPS